MIGEREVMFRRLEELAFVRGWMGLAAFLQRPAPDEMWWLPPFVAFADVTPDEQSQAIKYLLWLTAGLPSARTPEEVERDRHGRIKETRHLAMHGVFSWLRAKQDRGPSLFDGEDDDTGAEPLAVVRAKWAEWQALAGDTSGYELAWCVGAFRLIGMGVGLKADGSPEVKLNGRTPDAVGPVLAVLRKHRLSVIAHLQAGQEFDSADWQKQLVKVAAGEWPVWGERLFGADGGRRSVLPVVPTDPPPFYDLLFVVRPDCGRAIPVDALAVLTLAGCGIPAGRVYVGPATDDWPGLGEVLGAEIKVRKRNGITSHRVHP